MFGSEWRLVAFFSLVQVMVEVMGQVGFLVVERMLVFGMGTHSSWVA